MRLYFNNSNNDRNLMYGQVVPYIIRLLLLLLLKHSLIFYRIDRSTNKQILCGNMLDNIINRFFTSMKDVF